MTTIEEVSSRIRAIRLARGLTLREVESTSNLRIRAIALGSYERGDRTLSVRTAILIAEIYGMPLSYLLEAPEIRTSPSVAPVLDLRQFRKIAADSTITLSQNSTIRTLITFTGEIIKRRNDWNGELLSIRESDLTLLSAAIGVNQLQLMQILETHRLLIEVT